MTATNSLNHEHARFSGPVLKPIALFSLSALGASFVQDAQGFGTPITRSGTGVYVVTLPDDSTDVKVFLSAEVDNFTTALKYTRSGKVITITVATGTTPTDVANCKIHGMIVRRRDW